MPPPSGSTPTLLLPYPVPNDPVDVPRDIKALADKLDSSLGGGGTGGGGILKATPVLDVGMTGQVRAGRQLALADFTDLGLSAPAGLWNLSNLTDASGNGRTLSNKGAVPFAAGINGTAATAAQFSGSTAQALYIADTGAADPFRIRTGSVGAWFRTAKRGTQQVTLSKTGVSGAYTWSLNITNVNTASGWTSADGVNIVSATGVSDVTDDRWHFAVMTHDATAIRMYVDGVLEAVAAAAYTIGGGSGVVNIGAAGADGATAATNANYGRVDEAFVTNDVLTEDQIRVLYAARIVHGLTSAPRSANLTVNRKRKGAPLAPADFTTTPVRLHNFTAGALTDEGSGGVALTNNGTAVSVAGADGSVGGAFSFAGAQSLSATDAGLPAALAARSYGCWFKATTTGGGSAALMAWASSGTFTYIIAAGTVAAASGADTITGPYVLDGQWHHYAVTEDNAAVDQVRRKMYLDGRLVGGSTVLNSITLGGANQFRIGANSTGTNPFTGQLDGAFVTGYPLTAADIATLYAKSSQGLGASPKNAGDHVERMDATAVYFVGDTLESQHQIDLGVAS
jgi:hypothetical protein